MRWNEGVSFPIGSGHGCIGCSEDGFWDKGSFYERLTDVKHYMGNQPTGVNLFPAETTADTIGMGAAAGVAGGIAVHIAASAIKRAKMGDSSETAKPAQPAQTTTTE